VAVAVFFPSGIVGFVNDRMRARDRAGDAEKHVPVEKQAP
jgi:hypothetical protein